MIKLIKLVELINPAMQKQKILNILNSGKTPFVFSKGKTLSVLDKESIGDQSLFASGEDGDEHEVKYSDIEFVESDGKRLEEKILNGPQPEDPDTTGLKVNRAPIVPKQTDIGPYDVIDEKEDDDETGVEEAVMNYINGNISDFKEFINNCSKTDLLNVVRELTYRKAVTTHARSNPFENAIALVQKYLDD